MLGNMYLLLFVFSSLVIDSYASLVPFIQPCHPDDDECILTSTQHAIPYLAEGVPELGIPSADPMIIKNVTMDQGFVKLVFEDLKIYGAKRCKALEVKRNIKESSIQLKLNCPVEATGRYKFTGRLCFLDVNDEGDFKVTTESVLTTLTAKVKKTYGDDGKKHWKLISYEYSWDTSEKFFIYLDNLFAGNVAISEPFLNTLSKEWKTMVKRVGEPLVSSIVKYFYDVVKTFFLRVPIDELEYN